jgi:hypothetical protein
MPPMKYWEIVADKHSAAGEAQGSWQAARGQGGLYGHADSGQRVKAKGARIEFLRPARPASCPMAWQERLRTASLRRADV